jgi:pimeloyl-ACP methyl ester carboxylesterase
MAAVKAGLSSDPAAVVLLAAPLEWPDWPSLRVSLDDIQSLQAPILFVTSEGDRFAPDTQEMYAAARQPKEMHTFSGDAHGTDLFGTQHAAELGQLLIAFLEGHAPSRGD